MFLKVFAGDGAGLLFRQYLSVVIGEVIVGRCDDCFEPCGYTPNLLPGRQYSTFSKKPSLPLEGVLPPERRIVVYSDGDLY